MITIRIGAERITACGHAADAAGCAAVSALLYALAGGLANVGPGGDWRIGSGEAEIIVPGTPEAQAMRLMAEAGLRQVAAVREDIRIEDGAGQRSTVGGISHFDKRERPQEDLT